MTTDSEEDAYPRYTMNATDPSAYTEGAFAMEVRIFAEEPSLDFDDESALAALTLQEPIFTYNTAILR
jgi:hypothetical protein